MTYPWPQTWTTRDELAFISRIGLHPHSPLRRREALLSYRRSLDLRRVWIGIDRETVLAAVEEALEEVNQ